MSIATNSAVAAINPVPMQLKSSSVGDLASRQLLQHSSCVVEAVLSRCVYLSFDDGQLICLGERSIGQSPINILIDDNALLRLKQLRVGQALRIVEHCLQLPDGRMLNTHCHNFYHGDIGTLKFSSNALMSCYESLLNLDCPSESVYRHYVLQRHTVGIQGLVHERIQHVMLDIYPWLLRSCYTSQNLPAPASLKRLLGVGRGLTPAGDDVLAGMMLALRVCGYCSLADQLYASLSLTADQTNRVSVTMLELAAQGRACEANVKTLAMISGEMPYNHVELIQQLNSMGASSGWDSFAGMVLVFSALFSIPSAASICAPFFTSNSAKNTALKFATNPAQQ